MYNYDIVCKYCIRICAAACWPVESHVELYYRPTYMQRICSINYEHNNIRISYLRIIITNCCSEY